jgi:UDP-glucuronate 4-epimerase
VDSRTLHDQSILITGASGLFGRPLALSLHERNTVYALARFTDPAVREELESAGITTITCDLADVDVAGLPDVDYVVHAGALLPSTGSEKDRKRTFDVNVQATGRIMRRYADVKGFLYCGSGSVYAYQGRRPLHEDDPFGLHNGIETYSASKIAAESLVDFLCRDQQTPTTIVRIFTMYGPGSGTVTKRVDMVAAGKTIPVYPDGENNQGPLFVSDGVRLAEAALTIAAVPAPVVNLGGSETVSVQEYCRIAADLLGVDVSFREDPNAYYPIWPAVTRMHELLGTCEVGVREGIQRILDHGGSRLRQNWIPGAE